MRKYKNIIELDIEEALEAVEQTLQQEENEEIYVLQGMIYQNDWEGEKALESFETAYSLNPDSFLTNLALGRYYVLNYEAKKAIEYLKKALILKPYKETYYWMGRIYLYEDNEKSLEYYTKALMPGEDHELIFPIKNIQKDLGIVYYEIEEYDKAVECYRKAYKALGDEYYPFDDIIGVYMEAKRYEDALTVTNEKFESLPNEAMEIYGRRGEIHTCMEDYQEAVRNYDLAIEWGKENDAYSCWSAYNEKAQIFYKYLNNVERAEEILHESIDFAPDFEGAYIQLLELYENSGQAQKSIDFIQFGIGDKFADDTYYTREFTYFLAKAYFVKQEYTLAKENCLKAIELDTECADAYELLTKICHKANDIAFAIETYNKGVEQTGDEYLQSSMLTDLSELGYYEEAIVVADAMIEKDIRKAGTLFEKAMALTELERYTEAIEAYEEYNKLEPDTKRAFVNMFNCYKGLGEMEKALEACKTIIESDEDDIKHISYWQRAGVLYNRGEIKNALADYKAAYKYDPTYEFVMTDLPELYIMAGEYKKGLDLLEQGIAKNKDTYKQLIYHFLKFLAHYLQDNKNEAQKAEKAYLETGKGFEKPGTFTINKIIRFADVDEEKRNYIKELGGKYLNLD